MNTETVTRQPVHPFIDSDRVEDTPVVDANGAKIGTIERLVIEKVSGRVAYAIMSFGGFLGLGEKTRRVPWNALHYNPHFESYQLDRTADEIGSAPDDEEGERWSREREKALHDHYRVPPYWGV